MVALGLLALAFRTWWGDGGNGGESFEPSVISSGAGGTQEGSNLPTTEEPVGLTPREATDARQIVGQASIANVPPESLVSRGLDASGGVNVSNDPRLGNPGAPVVIVVFSDFQCPHCAEFHNNTFPALRSLYGDRVRWYFVNRFLPEGRPFSAAAAIAAECAHRHGRFWEYADEVFKRREGLSPDLFPQIALQVGLDANLFEQCQNDLAIAAEVVADTTEGQRVGAEIAPTFFINGQKILGAQPVGVFNQVIGPYFK